MSAGINVYIQEAREHLEKAEEILLSCEKELPSDDDVGALFRAFHTIKGSGGVFELEHLVFYTHQLESLLAKVRNNELELKGDLHDALFKGRDHLESLINALEITEKPSQELIDVSTTIIKSLEPWLGAVEAKQSKGETEKQTPNKSQVWHIALRLNPQVLLWGMDPLSFISCLESDEIGIIKGLVAIRLVEKFEDVKNLSLGFEISLEASVSKEEIVENFEFMEDGSTILVFSDSEKKEKKAWIKKCKSENKSDWEKALKKLPSLQNIEEKKAIAKVKVKAKNKTESKSAPKAGAQIKVDSDRLNFLINLMGEVTITSSMVNNKILSSGDKELKESYESLNALIDEIRESSLKLRMVPIRSAFTRFPRVVRDISKKLKKEIRLVTEGEDTELDRALVDKIIDPLMHLVRNSLDHGIESPEKRVAAGKSAEGTLTLRAYTESNSICIEIADDGGGINRARVLAIAVEKGIIQPDQKPTDDETVNLIFAAGFSTADEVSDISGRGVGMDVVRKNIEELRGFIQLKSIEGEGTSFKLFLPLSLAIIDGFLIRSSRQHFVIPLENVDECIPLGEEQAHEKMINIRGEFLPLLHIDKKLDLENVDSIKNVVILKIGDSKVGVVTNELHGEIQTVIKPLGPLFRHLKGFSGTTVLGNGELALILDVAALAHLG
jgi:two-component system chemotaxis sensor kinase CheA